MFKEFIGHIVMLAIFLVLGVWYYYADTYNNKLEQKKEQMIVQQDNLEKEIDNILKWKSIQKLNDSYLLLKKYFYNRSSILMLEMWIFLEYVYPEDNFIDTLDIDKKGKEIKLNFYSANLENIRRLYRNLEYLKKNNIITEFNLGEVKLNRKVKVKQWEKQVYKFYSLSFKFNPNYSLVRDFILEHNKKLKIPFEKNYILLQGKIKQKVQEKFDTSKKKVEK